MKVIYILPFLLISTWALPKEEAFLSPRGILESGKLQLSKKDFVIAEHLLNMIKLINKGYVNKEIMSRLLADVSSSTHFKPFLPWLREVKEISQLSTTSSVITTCNQYTAEKSVLPLEKRLERLVGNFCREKALELIGRDIEKYNALSEEATQFIQENLKYYLVKKNKKSFAYFLQSLSKNKDILMKVSNEISTYSVSHDIVPSPEVLKDIEINEQITKLIQTKGFQPAQHKNVYYAEYGKLIEMAYRSLKSTNDEGPELKKVQGSYNNLRKYLEQNRSNLPEGLCLSRLSDFGKAVFRNNFTDLARDVFKYIANQKNKENYEDALFFYLWTYISTGDLKGGMKLAKKYDLLKKDTQISDPRLKFWIGHTYEKLDQHKDAINVYEETVEKHPLSYYAIMSYKKLQALKPDSPLVNFYASRVTKGEIQNLKISDLEEDYLSSLVRLKAWAKIDSQKMMDIELKRLRVHSMPAFLVKQPSDKQLDINSDLHLMNAMILQDADNHLAAFRYLYAALDKTEVKFDRNLLELLYPRPYMSELIRVLKGDKLDPIIVLSLIRQESVFNPRAKSRVGARGLMQLMPSTAKRMRRSVAVKHLSNPKINIELGTKYFKGLLKRYDGNLVYVLSAYNAGEGRVERWKDQYWSNENSILTNIEQIPFLETRNYVKLIFRNIFFYKLLLEKSEVADSGAPNKIFDVNLGFNQ